MVWCEGKMNQDTGWTEAKDDLYYIDITSDPETVTSLLVDIRLLLRQKEPKQHNFKTILWSVCLLKKNSEACFDENQWYFEHAMCTIFNRYLDKISTATYCTV